MGPIAPYRNMANVANSFTLDMSKVKLAAAEKRVINQGDTFHTQPLSYDGEKLLIMSSWFKSNGVSYSTQFDKNRPEMLVKLNDGMKKVIHEIETLAAKSFHIPNELKIPPGTNKDSLFKRIPNVDNLFVKLSPECMCYDMDLMPINRKQLGHGNYRAVVNVIAVHIAPHGQTGKIASLTMRISQIQYEAIKIPCLFSNSSTNVLNFDDIESVNAHTTIAAAEKVTKPARKARRPKLQRQNAIEVNEDVRAMENMFPKDLFDEVIDL